MSADEGNFSNHGVNLPHHCFGVANNFKKYKKRTKINCIFLPKKLNNSKTQQEVKDENLNI